jgi:hypothetical protein
VSGCCADRLPMMALPFPFVALLKLGLWTHVLFLIRWHFNLGKRLQTGRQRIYVGPLPDYPLVASPLWKLQGMHVSEPNARPAMPMSSQTFADISLCLKHCQAEIHQQQPNFDVAKFVRMLDSWASSTDGAANKQESANRHGSEKLLECIRLCRFLKGGPATLHAVVARSISLELPPDMRSLCVDSAGKLINKPPSASILRRYEFALDVGLVVLQRMRSVKMSSSVVHFSLADSSPMCGYDWIWSQYHEIEKDKLVEVFDAVVNLTASIVGYCNRVEELSGPALDEDMHDVSELRDAYVHLKFDSEPLPEWKEWLRCIRSNIYEHINPPMALGSGHRALSDKTAAECFKLRLQTDASVDLDAVARSFASQSGDMGLEMGMPAFRVASQDSLLPDWAIGLA